jgi:hypothetical protein
VAGDITTQPKQCRQAVPLISKEKIDCLRFAVTATSATFLAFLSFFLAVAINSTNEDNKSGGTCR